MGRRKNPASSPATPPAARPPQIHQDDFRLYYLEALKDQEVAGQLRSLLKISDQLIDAVAARLDSRLKHYLSQLDDKDQQIKLLRDEVEELKQANDDNEQYSRRTFVRVNGIAETPTEVPEEKVMEIFRAAPEFSPVSDATTSLQLS